MSRRESGELGLALFGIFVVLSAGLYLAGLALSFSQDAMELLYTAIICLGATSAFAMTNRDLGPAVALFSTMFLVQLFLGMLFIHVLPPQQAVFAATITAVAFWAAVLILILI